MLKSCEAFDPIFWLHHTNVDRMLSLWRAMNPDAWVTPGRNQGGTMGISPRASINMDTRMSIQKLRDLTYCDNIILTQLSNHSTKPRTRFGPRHP